VPVFYSLFDDAAELKVVRRVTDRVSPYFEAAFGPLRKFVSGGFRSSKSQQSVRTEETQPADG